MRRNIVQARDEIIDDLISYYRFLKKDMRNHFFNALIAKKNKDELNFTTEEKIAKSNLAWSAIGFTVGLIAHYTIIDRR